MTTLDAVKHLIESGASIEMKGRHIYRRGKGYTVLKYEGENYNLTMEKDFALIEAALSFFASEVGL